MNFLPWHGESDGHVGLENGRMVAEITVRMFAVVDRNTLIDLFYYHGTIRSFLIGQYSQSTAVCFGSKTDCS